jgi:hypothetical protein
MSQIGGQWYSDTSPFSIPCTNIRQAYRGKCSSLLFHRVNDKVKNRFIPSAPEPTYNNLDPAWLRSASKVSAAPPPPPPTLPPPQTAPRTHFYPPHAQRTFYSSPTSNQDVDAFSEEFDLRMRFSSGSQLRQQHQQNPGVNFDNIL